MCIEQRPHEGGRGGEQEGRNGKWWHVSQSEQRQADGASRVAWWTVSGLLSTTSLCTSSTVGISVLSLSRWKFSETEADGFKQQLSFLKACVSDTVKKFTLDPQNNPMRDITITPVCRWDRGWLIKLPEFTWLWYSTARILLCYFSGSDTGRKGATPLASTYRLPRIIFSEILSVSTQVTLKEFTAY